MTDHALADEYETMSKQRGVRCVCGWTTDRGYPTETEALEALEDHLMEARNV